jgi:hypothetical protein
MVCPQVSLSVTWEPGSYTPEILLNLMYSMRKAWVKWSSWNAVFRLQSWRWLPKMTPKTSSVILEIFYFLGQWLLNWIKLVSENPVFTSVGFSLCLTKDLPNWQDEDDGLSYVCRPTFVGMTWDWMVSYYTLSVSCHTIILGSCTHAGKGRIVQWGVVWGRIVL